MTAAEWANCDAYLFDIDGTLLNSRDGVHYHAFHHAVQAVFDIDSRIDGLPVHGNTDIGILRALIHREGLTDAEFEARLPRVIEHMCAEVLENAADIRVQLCPSIRELLERLHASGKLLGVASGNLETIGWTKLKAAEIRDFFSFGCFSDTAELREDIFRMGVAKARRQLGENASVCVVGDTPSDIQAARKAGIPVISVATGFYPYDELSRLEPDLCLTCCAELLQQD